MILIRLNLNQNLLKSRILYGLTRIISYTAMQDNHEDEDKAKDILNRHRVELKKKYLVEQTGIGYKIQNGKLTDTVAILFYVKKKKNKDELEAEGVFPIPKEIEGIPTDVIAIPEGFKPQQSLTGGIKQ